MDNKIIIEINTPRIPLRLPLKFSEQNIKIDKRKKSIFFNNPGISNTANIHGKKRRNVTIPNPFASVHKPEARYDFAKPGMFKKFISTKP
jgi:hypothetical protein